MLCAVCLSMFHKAGFHGPHHQNLEDIIKSARNGCRICLFLGRQLEKQNPVSRDGSKEVVLKFSFDPICKTFGIRTMQGHSFEFELSAEGTRLTQLTRYWKDHRVMKRAIRSNPTRVLDDSWTRTFDVATNTGDKRAMQTAELWLQTCLDKHIDCKKRHELVVKAQRSSVDGTTATSWQPKRLIDCSRQDGRLHLKYRGDHLFDGSYATLSHCWGQGETFFKLDPDQEQKISNGQVLLSDLPKTFRDAMDVCRHLRIKYLWIDSVCILQSGDGGEDWQLHAREMSEIYSACLLNLASEHAGNPNGGMFVDRDPNIVRPAIVPKPFAFRQGGVRSRKLRHQVAVHTGLFSRSYEVRIPPWDHAIGKSLTRLSTRGWVLQERLLPVRTLHFTEQRIAWSCVGGFTQEQYASDFRDQGFRRALPYETFLEKVHSWDKVLFSGKSWYFWASWSEQIEDYSRYQLTYPDKDKLVAFAGVAKVFNTHMNDVYLAGIFRESLPSWLLWRTANNNNKLPAAELRSYRAPSWSWASVDCAIDYNIILTEQVYLRELSLVDLVESSVCLVDEDNPYGQVSGGSIVLDGAAIPYTLVNKTALHVHADGRQTVANEELLLLPLVAMDHRFETGDWWMHVYGLVIEAHPSLDAYKRVGMFQCSHDGMSSALLKNDTQKQRIKLI